MPPAQVTVVGRIQRIVEETTVRIYHLYDGTGTIFAKVWKETDPGAGPVRTSGCWHPCPEEPPPGGAGSSALGQGHNSWVKGLPRDRARPGTCRMPPRLSCVRACTCA